MLTTVRALAAGLILFPLCLLLHELFHLALLGALGGTGTLIVRPWHFEFLPLAIPSLHVTGGPGLDPLRRVLFDLGGPLLATLPLLALAAVLPRPALRAALLANVGILCFFAFLETADYLLDSRLGRDLPLLTWEEFNYGLPLLLLLFVAVRAGRFRTAPEQASIPAV